MRPTQTKSALVLRVVGQLPLLDNLCHDIHACRACLQNLLFPVGQNIKTTHDVVYWHSNGPKDTSVSSSTRTGCSALVLYHHRNQLGLKRRSIPHNDQSSSFHCLECPQLCKADLADNEPMKRKLGTMNLVVIYPYKL